MFKRWKIIETTDPCKMRKLLSTLSYTDILAYAVREAPISLLDGWSYSDLKGNGYYLPTPKIIMYVHGSSKDLRYVDKLWADIYINPIVCESTDCCYSEMRPVTPTLYSPPPIIDVPSGSEVLWADDRPYVIHKLRL